MEEVLALIGKLLEEHKLIKQRAQTLEQIANDISALVGLDEAKEDFMPGKFDQRQGLQKMQSPWKESIKGSRHILSGKKRPS